MRHWIAIDPKDEGCLKFALQHPVLNNDDCYDFEQEAEKKPSGELDNITLYFQTRHPLSEEDQTNLSSPKGVLNCSFNEE
jgi:hypothetical protein